MQKIQNYGDNDYGKADLFFKMQNNSDNGKAD